MTAVKLITFTSFAVYLYKIKRKNCFEMSIVTLLIIKIVTIVIGPVIQFLFATQYIKTCIVVPGLVKKAEHILDKHQTTI